MHNLKICFPTSDVEMKDEIKKMFGENIDFVEERSVTGMDVVLVAIIPVASLTVQIIDFILTYLVKGEETPSNTENQNKKQCRKIEVSNSRITLYDYSAEEATAILRSIWDNDNV